LAVPFEYEKRFIRSEIVKPGLEYASVPTTKPIHLSYIDYFEGNGWTKAPIPGQPKRFRLFDPSGHEVVTLKRLSATRHPASTTKICRFKHYTKKMLDLAGVANPAGSEFLPTEKEIGAAYFGKLPKPAVVKPTNAASSDGVTVGVVSEEQFATAWDRALEAGNQHTRVLIEQFVEGVEVRAFVVNSRVVASVVRLPPFIVGDNKSSVSQLIKRDQEARDVNRKIRSKFAIDWSVIKNAGYTSESIPTEGDIVVVGCFKTTALGGLFFDVTDRLHDSIEDVAVRATNAIPHLEISGIDLLVDSVDNPGVVNVIEVNTTPATDLHRYPTYGLPRPVEKYVADFYDSEYRERIKGSSSCPTDPTSRHG